MIHIFTVLCQFIRATDLNVNFFSGFFSSRERNGEVMAKKWKFTSIICETICELCKYFAFEMSLHSNSGRELWRRKNIQTNH